MNQIAAEQTSFLEERIKQNEHNQSLNLNEWAFMNIEPDNKSLSILELCCGTGKQTEYLTKLFPNANITAIDISNDAINTMKLKFSQVNSIVTGIDEFINTTTDKFDIIFVSYGLYYASNLDDTISKIINSLNVGGKFIVLGPYGNNNKSLFDLVKSTGAKINEFVLYSCTDFMYDKVLRLSMTNFKDIKINTAVNTIKWKSYEDVIMYWKNTTFFDAAKENIFRTKLIDYFNSNDTFNNEKHIMLFQGLKKV